VTKPKSQKPQSFEQALAEIESIVAAMEAGSFARAVPGGLQTRCGTPPVLPGAATGSPTQVKVLEAGTLQNFSGDDGKE